MPCISQVWAASQLGRAPYEFELAIGLLRFGPAVLLKGACALSCHMEL